MDKSSVFWKFPEQAEENHERPVRVVLVLTEI
jgi:hypothetical protein